MRPDRAELAGSLPSKQTRLVRAWIEMYPEELLADWNLAVEGAEVFKIDPLRQLNMNPHVTDVEAQVRSRRALGRRGQFRAPPEEMAARGMIADPEGLGR